MPKNWTLARIGDISSTNLRTYSLSEKWPYVNYLDTGNVTENRIDQIQRLAMGEDPLPSRARRKVEVGDIIYSTVRPNQRHYGIIKEVLPNMLVSTGFTVISPNIRKVDPDFLYYFLTRNEIVESLHAIGEQSVSAYPSIRPSDIENLEIALPPLPEQIEIGRTLRALDEKIANNTRINNQLEQIAQAIFKSWFVDFEPFGGSMPDDWEYIELGNVTSEIRTRAKERLLRVLSAVRTSRLVLSDDYFTKQVYSKDINKYIVVEPNDFAYNPARVNIGSLGLNSFDFTGCVSPVYVVFRAKPEYHHFLNFFFKSPNFQEEVRVRASGSVRQSLSYNDFSLIQVLYPSLDVVCRFNNKYENILKVQHGLDKENTILAELRDALLPRLVSGELSVSGIGGAA